MVTIWSWYQDKPIMYHAFFTHSWQILSFQLFLMLIHEVFHVRGTIS
jgi:hypothetical protein